MKHPLFETGKTLTRYCSPQDCAYFLDFDGTLVEIAERPDAVAIEPALLDLLEQLNAAASGAIAIISGRPIADIDRWFAPIRWPVAGQHGAERRSAHGTVYRHADQQPALGSLRAAATEWQVRYPGLVVEDKGLSIAFHFRDNPQLQAPLKERLEGQLRLLPNFQLQTGKMVLELKPDGLDKGRAIREFLSEPPFLGRAPVFIGDDDTDEFGFLEVNVLGGVSIKVGAGPTAAIQRLENVAAVRDWLRCVVESANLESPHA